MSSLMLARDQRELGFMLAELAGLSSQFSYSKNGLNGQPRMITETIWKIWNYCCLMNEFSIGYCTLIGSWLTWSFMVNIIFPTRIATTSGPISQFQANPFRNCPICPFQEKRRCWVTMHPRQQHDDRRVVTTMDKGVISKIWNRYGMIMGFSIVMEVPQ